MLAAFLLVVAAPLSSQAWLLSRQGELHASLRLVSEVYLPLSKHVVRLRRDHDRVQRDLERVRQERPRPSAGGPSAAEIYTAELEEVLKIARVIAERPRTMEVPHEERAVIAKSLAHLDALDVLFARYAEKASSYLALARATEAAEDAREAMRRQVRNTGNQLADELDALERMIDVRTRTVAMRTEQAQARATAVASGLTFVAGVLAFLVVVAVVMALRPITQLTAAVQRLARGETGEWVDVQASGEVAVLAREFNAMVRAISSRDARLQDRAEELDRLSAHLVSILDALDDALLVVEDGLVTRANPAARQGWGAEVGAPPPRRLEELVAGPGAAELGPWEGRVYAGRSVALGSTGMVVVLTDISAMVQAQERLARSERLALIGQMLAQITHEVRNPLNALSLNAELLGDELEALDPSRSAEAWEILAMVVAEIERLTALTGHYLQLARRPKARMEPVVPARMVDEAVRLLGPELDAAGVRLRVAVEVSETVWLDGGQGRQALLNLIGNAREAGARAIRVRVWLDGADLCVSVADDGPGMAPAEVSRAMDPFFTTKASGTGLGLAITRQILEDHHGRVDVMSEPGQGTTITLVYPDALHAPSDREEEE